MHLLTYTWLMAKHYNTQNDSASLPVLRRHQTFTNFGSSTVRAR